MLIFLSYSREDQERVGQVRADLEELGHVVWLDRRLSGGAEWWTAILGQIRTADVLVLCVTESSLRSEACLAELGYARAVDRHVVPVQLTGGLDATLAPAPLPRLQWIPYLHGDKTELFGLIRALSGNLPGDLPDPLPPDPPVPGSYLMVLSEQVRTPDRLDLPQQLLVLHRIEAGIAQVRQHAALAALLTEFRRRHDLLAEVLPTLERLRVQLEPDGPVRAVDIPASEPAEHRPPRRIAAPAGPAETAPTPWAAVVWVTIVQRAIDSARLSAGQWHVDPAIPNRHRDKIVGRFAPEDGERLIAVYDMTIFNTGGKYFAFTDRHLLHHGLPRPVRWETIDLSSIGFDRSRSRILVGDGSNVFRLDFSFVAMGETFADLLRSVVRQVQVGRGR